MGGELSCRGVVCRELVLFRADWPFATSDVPLNQRINRIHSDHKWPERVVSNTTRAKLAPAEAAQVETEPQGQEASQEPVAERHDPVEAFAEMERETVEGCLQPPCSADQNPESGPPPKRKAALLRLHPRVSKAAKAFTVPNPFHKLPGKS